MNKLQTVQAALTQFPEIAAWYTTEIGIDLNAMTDESVRVYGTGNHGDIADSILADTDMIMAGLLTEI